MYSRINHVENLNIDLEYDSAYGHDAHLVEIEQELDELAASKKIVICGEVIGPLEDCSYIYLDPDYEGELSMAQRELYELLLTLQTASVYTITTVGKLAQELDLKHSSACGQRFANLQSLGAISGLKWNKP